MSGPTFHYYCQNWQPNAIAMCQSLHCLFSYGFCVCFASDNHLKICQATRRKTQSSPHVMSVLKQAKSLISPIGKARALEPAAGNGVWATKDLQNSIHHLQYLCFCNIPSSACCFSGMSSSFAVAVTFSKMLNCFRT